MSSKVVENTTINCDETDIKDKGLLLVSVRERGSAPLVLRRFSEDEKVVLEQVIQGGFRKIEPKPSNDSKEDDDEDSGRTQSARLLDSTSTRRGVRICPTCQGRVGFRSKFCKHCFKSSGNSNKCTTKAKKRRVAQQKNRRKSKNTTKRIREGSELCHENSEESHATASIDNFDVQISSPNPETLLYVHVPTTTSSLETISNIDSNISEAANRTLSIENDCQILRIVNSNNDDVEYKAQTQLEVDKGNESSFSKVQTGLIGHEDCLEVNNSGHELSQNLDHETCNQEFTLCRNNSIPNLPDMTVGTDNEKLCQNVDLRQDSNITSNVLGTLSESSGNNITYKVNDAGNLGTLAGVENTGNDVQRQTNVLKTLIDDREKLASYTEVYNGSACNEDIQNEEDLTIHGTSDGVTSEDLNSKVVPLNENGSPRIILVDVNSIGSISVTTTDDNSQSADTNTVQVSENSFVFENTNVNASTGNENGEGSVDILEEIKVRSEQRENVKRKKKPKLWQELRDRKKKAKVSTVQFVRIEPKPFVDIAEESTKNKQGNVKQNRLLPSNPTRRGVMLCPMCQKDVGCRSRTCKYCKVAINLYSSKSPLDQKNLLAVELCEETSPEYTIFSVKKTLNASEDRCFVKKFKTTAENGFPKNDRIPEVFSCDCVGNIPSEKPSCEHTMCMYKSPKITQARNIILTPSKIGTLPIDVIFKHKLSELWNEVKDKEFPLVQQVCQNTLVVLDVGLNVERTPSSCIHVRFEKIRRRSVSELHIFCSGMTCSAWNVVEDGEKDNPVTCIHYCVSLWAIASDDDLQKYLKVFLDATQVYLHSEVFDNALE